MKLDPTIIKLAIPIILANASTPLVGLVDTAMLGFSATGDYLAALTIGTTVLSSIYWMFGYLKMALTGIVAQARGRKDSDCINTQFMNSARNALVIALFLMITSPLIIDLSLYFLGSSDAINAYARDYIQIRLLSAPAIMLNLVITGLLFGLAKPNQVLLIFSVLNGTNIVLDILFVKGFGLDIKGVAYASAIAEYMALAVGIICIKHLINVRVRDFFTKSTSTIKSNKSLYADLFIRTILLQAILLFFVRYSAQFGPEILAANGILLQIGILTFYGLDGIAHSAEMLVGAAYGKKDTAAFDFYCRQCLYWGALLSIATALILFFGKNFIIGLLTDINSITNIIDEYYGWLILLPITSVTCFVYDGIFIGTSETRIMRNMMFITILIFAAFVLLLVPLLANHGLWLCYHASMVIRAITLYIAMPKVRRAMLIAHD